MNHVQSVGGPFAEPPSPGLVAGLPIPAESARLIDFEAHQRSQEEELLAALMARIAGGEQAALASFYDATVGRAYGLALSVCGGDQAAAEATVEDAYASAWRSARTRPEGATLPWLLGLVRDGGLRHLGPACAALPDLLTLTRPRSAMHQALTQLTTMQRAAVCAAVLRGGDFAVIAGALGTSSGTAKAVLRAGLKRLSAQLRTN